MHVFMLELFENKDLAYICAKSHNFIYPQKNIENFNF